LQYFQHVADYETVVAHEKSLRKKKPGGFFVFSFRTARQKKRRTSAKKGRLTLYRL
jgi:hypothetical protein